VLNDAPYMASVVASGILRNAKAIHIPSTRPPPLDAGTGASLEPELGASSEPHGGGPLRFLPDRFAPWRRRAAPNAAARSATTATAGNEVDERGFTRAATPRTPPRTAQRTPPPRSTGLELSLGSADAWATPTDVPRSPPPRPAPPTQATLSAPSPPSPLPPLDFLLSRPDPALFGLQTAAVRLAMTPTVGPAVAATPTPPPVTLCAPALGETSPTPPGSSDPQRNGPLSFVPTRFAPWRKKNENSDTVTAQINANLEALSGTPI
jgi:hypothetical protein